MTVPGPERPSGDETEVVLVASRAELWSLLTFLAVVAAGLAFSFASLESLCRSSPVPPESCSQRGGWLLVVSAVPVAVAAVPLVRRTRRAVRGVALALTVMFLIGGGFGILLIPALVPAVIATVAAYSD